MSGNLSIINESYRIGGTTAIETTTEIQNLPKLDGRRRKRSIREREAYSKAAFKRHQNRNNPVKSTSIATMWPQNLDCKCGRALTEHPCLPNSTYLAVDSFCPFLELKKLGLL